MAYDALMAAVVIVNMDWYMTITMGDLVYSIIFSQYKSEEEDAIN